MSIALSPLQLRRLRIQHQLLTDSSRSSSAAEIVRRLCALQAQEWSSAQFAILARARGVRQADVVDAREAERAFILTWTLRGTLHLVAAEDIRWQLDLCGAGAIRATRRRYQQLGLTEQLRERSLAEIADILEGAGALTRAELAERLGRRGIPVAGQAIHHLVRHAALRGLICLGAERNGDLTYTLLDEWLPAAATVEEPLALFARRYLEAYAPASAADFARWSGLSAAQVRRAWDAIAAECVTVATAEGEARMLRGQSPGMERIQPEAGARFLPRYDNYLLAYKSRAFMVAAAHAKRVHPGGGLIRACVIIDGQAAANWKLEKRAKATRIVVSSFEGLSMGDVSLLEAEAQSLGRFLEASVELRVESA